MRPKGKGSLTVMVPLRQYSRSDYDCKCQLAPHSIGKPMQGKQPQQKVKALCCSSALRLWTNLLERPCLCLVPEEPLLLLLLLQEFHLEQLLLRCDCVEGRGLQHGAGAPLQHVGQGLLRVGWDEGARWIQPGTT